MIVYFLGLALFHFFNENFSWFSDCGMSYKNHTEANVNDFLDLWTLLKFFINWLEVAFHILELLIEKILYLINFNMGEQYGLNSEKTQNELIKFLVLSVHSPIQTFSRFRISFFLLISHSDIFEVCDQALLCSFKRKMAR